MIVVPYLLPCTAETAPHYRCDPAGQTAPCAPCPLERAYAGVGCCVAVNRSQASDLALPAEKCDAELATVCLPSKVVLISAAVRGGTLHVLRIDASPDEWRRAGKSIKEVRSTFAVTA